MGSWRLIELHLTLLFAFVHKVRLLDCGDGQVGDCVPLRLGVSSRSSALLAVGVDSPKVSMNPRVIQHAAGDAVTITAGMAVICRRRQTALFIEQTPSQGSGTS